MPWKYIAGRLTMFIVTIWMASTIVFFLPRLSGQNPLAEKIYQEAQQGGYLDPDVAERVRVFEAKYGFDKPLWEQYVKFVVDVVQFDLGRSIFQWPKTVNEILAEKIMWTLVMGLLTLILAFLIGSTMGALLEWRRNNWGLMVAMAPILAISAVPFFIFGLVLQLVVFNVDREFPLVYGFKQGVVGWPDWSDWEFIFSVLKHAILPALSITLVSLGGWAMGMRGMMVTTKGEDYMVQAEAKGLPDRVMLTKYAVRNSLLPQVTGLTLALGLIVSGVVLVEIVFGYPGVGGQLLQAVRSNDYPTTQGIVFVLAFGTAAATLVLDLIYPLLDPRIKSGGP